MAHGEKPKINLHEKAWRLTEIDSGESFCSVLIHSPHRRTENKSSHAWNSHLTRLAIFNPWGMPFFFTEINFSHLLTRREISVIGLTSHCSSRGLLDKKFSTVWPFCDKNYSSRFLLACWYCTAYEMLYNWFVILVISFKSPFDKKLHCLPLISVQVKIIKCLVGNIVVDISFNQLGGLCTLCFLEEVISTHFEQKRLNIDMTLFSKYILLLQVDNLINQSHLFKRSIILIKAWCYYESRILGAHHGLISTYALETLVLYIFHVFNNNFAGPLEVMFINVGYVRLTVSPCTLI